MDTVSARERAYRAGFKARLESATPEPPLGISMPVFEIGVLTAEQVLATRNSMNDLRSAWPGDWPALAPDTWDGIKDAPLALYVPFEQLFPWGGGLEPLWRRDGRELYYRNVRGEMFAAAVGPGLQHVVGP